MIDINTSFFYQFSITYSYLCRVLSVQDKPPQQHRFKDSRIPSHVTYAYQKGVTIIPNDDFYEIPEGVNKTIDLLFLMSNAPVSTMSLPESGSAAYVGLANTMRMATAELSKKFPSFFGESTSDSKGHDVTTEPRTLWV